MTSSACVRPAGDTQAPVRQKERLISPPMLEDFQNLIDMGVRGASLGLFRDGLDL